MKAITELQGLPGIELRSGAAEPRRVHGVEPGIVVAPENAEAVAAVLRLASELGWHVELAGCGSLGDAGRAPGRVDLLITTDRLRETPEHAPADMTVTAGAGITLGELADRLAPERQFLPLDPPGAVRASLGAVVARGEAGPLRLGYGTPRDHVLGLQLVTADGRILELGGRVMKNVAGYDLVRLAVGSRGTLGLITRVTARLRPIPRSDATLALRSPTDGACVAAARRILAERLDPVAMELLSPEASAHVAAAGGWTLLVRLHGAAGAVEALATRIEHVAAQEQLAGERLDPDVAAVAWRTLSDLEAASPLCVRLASRPMELERTLALASALADVGAGWHVVAHAGDGIVRVLAPPRSLVAGDAVPPWDAVAAAIGRARLTLSASGGTAIVARAPEELLARVDPYGGIHGLELMRAIRKTFDPAGVLAPGRFEI